MSGMLSTMSKRIAGSADKVGADGGVSVNLIRLMYVRREQL